MLTAGELDTAVQKMESAKVGRFPDALDGSTGMAQGLSILQIAVARPLPAYHQGCSVV